MNGLPLKDIPEERIFELVERLDVRGPRYTSYPTVPVWKENFPAEIFEQALQRLAEDRSPIAVYLHFPFCRTRCLYCGCNSYICNDDDRQTKYAQALDTEIDRVGELLGGNVHHAQLHLGGGTPTHTPLELLAASLDRVLRAIPGTDDAERSIEVDPRMTTDAYLQMLAEHGFRRISVGLQDLNPDVQKAVKREYSLVQMKDFVQRARAFGFTGVNIDLIYGLPLQTRQSWRQTLESILDLQPDRLACFGYAHLPARIKHQRVIREEDLPSPRERLGMILDANRCLTANGYEAVGMDHFAKPSDELALARREGRVWRNFMGYTTIRNMELVGIGCSSISEFRDAFAQNVVEPEAYSKTIAEKRWAVIKGQVVDHEDRIRKQIINHLMCNLEIDIPEEAGLASNGCGESLRHAMASLSHYEAEGLLVARNGGYSVTPLGQLFLRNLAMPFDRYLNQQAASGFSRTV